MPHINFSREANAIVVAPARADFIAKLAQGRAELHARDIGELLGHRMAFIDVPDSFLAHPSLANLPARSVVLVPTLHADPGAPAPDVLRHTVEQLRQRGFRIGLPDPTVMTEFAHLLPQADFIVVQAKGLDARRGLQLSNIALEIAPNARLVVRELPSIEEFRFCYKLGATLFQGPFVTSREDLRRLSALVQARATSRTTPLPTTGTGLPRHPLRRRPRE